MSTIVVRGQHVLLIRETDGQRTFYSEPVGHVEIGETPRRAAAREVREETGYQVRIGRVLGVYQTVHSRRGYADSLRIVFCGRLTASAAANPKDDRTHPVWVKRNDLARYIPKITRPASRRALRDYLGAARRHRAIVIATLRRPSRKEDRMTTQAKQSVVLTCSHGGQCPVVEWDDSEVVVSDDFGGSVRLSHAQFVKLQAVTTTVPPTKTK